MSINDNYEAVVIESKKINALIEFITQVATGPQEAIGMLHFAIKTIDEINAEQCGQPPRSAEQLGQELTTCLLLAEKAMQ